MIADHLAFKIYGFTIWELGIHRATGLEGRAYSFSGVTDQGSDRVGPFTIYDLGRRANLPFRFPVFAFRSYRLHPRPSPSLLSPPVRLGLFAVHPRRARRALRAFVVNSPVPSNIPSPCPPCPPWLNVFPAWMMKMKMTMKTKSDARLRAPSGSDRFPVSGLPTLPKLSPLRHRLPGEAGNVPTAPRTSASRNLNPTF
jgi:hypothetical protein